ncbi:MAG: hypothetical protein QOI57_2985 [Rubrobacteraceae bacterium]|nr:hypothetical protein [Rubrobacteraceae bacterium]
MEDAGHSDTTSERRPGTMSERRRERVRMEISREAARLFWEHGVDGTTGEQIAEAVGLSVRTIWRYFRNKESCAEPVLAQDVEEIVAMMRRGPREVSLEDHLVAWATNRPRDPDQQAYDLAVIRMTVLAETEPALHDQLVAVDQERSGDVGVQSRQQPVVDREEDLLAVVDAEDRARDRLQRLHLRLERMHRVGERRGIRRHGPPKLISGGQAMRRRLSRAALAAVRTGSHNRRAGATRRSR